MASSEIKASVIIPARDAMAFIEKTVQSVLNEMCSDAVEIIIVNDGMDDSLAGLAERYPVTVIAGDGTGPAAARNIGAIVHRTSWPGGRGDPRSYRRAALSSPII